ncbi:MAG: cysteine desulfurase [Bifidobacteriaceae bacterium]|jgi:cysteine desulfurase|nr:cysteine desulfurase [Bifidobacteriaceae bacterium]
MTFLDYASAWPITNKALDEFNKVAKLLGNPASAHSYGFRLYKIVENSRSTIANYLRTRPKNIIFTSGGTESNNLAIQGIYQKAISVSKVRNKIITTAIEHPSVLEIVKKLAGSNVIYNKVDKNGLVDLDDLSKNLVKYANTLALVSIQYINNEIGTKQDILSIVKLCQKYNAPYHTDAVQAHDFCQLSEVGQLSKLAKMDKTFISISSHKIGGPAGIGALVVPDYQIIDPLLAGGGQEMALRSGSLDAALISAFAIACQDIEQNKDFVNRVKVYANQIVEALPQGVKLNGLPINHSNRVNYILNLSVKTSKTPDEVAYLFDSNNLAISFGSACAARTLGPSNTLLALGQNSDLASKGLRVSFGLSTSQTDINNFLKIINLL